MPVKGKPVEAASFLLVTTSPAEVNGGGRFFGGDDAEHRDWIGNVVGMVEEEEMMDGLDNKQVKAEEMRKGLECAEGWSK